MHKMSASNATTAATNRVRAEYHDGDRVMMIDFPDNTTLQAWHNLVSTIKKLAIRVFTRRAQADGLQGGLTKDQKQRGRRFLVLVTNLREMGYGVPPSIETAEADWKQLARSNSNRAQQQ